MSGTKGTVLVPADIDHTGTADVTSKVQAFIDATPDGWTIKFQPDAIYRCEFPLFLTKRTGIVIDLNGSTLVNKVLFPYPTKDQFKKQDDQRRRQFWLSGCHNCRITNGSLLGTGSPLDSATIGEVYKDSYALQVAIFVSSGSQLELDHLKIRNSRSDFLEFIADSGGPLCTFVHVHHLDCSGASRQAISFAGATDILIEDSRFANFRRHALDVESDTLAFDAKQQRIKIRNCDFDAVQKPLGFLNVGGTSKTISDLTIGGPNPEDGNRLHGVSLDSIVIDPGGVLCHRFEMGWNTSDTPGNAPASGRKRLIWVRSWDDVNIHDNVAPCEIGPDGNGIGEIGILLTAPVTNVSGIGTNTFANASAEVVHGNP